MLTSATMIRPPLSAHSSRGSTAVPQGIVNHSHSAPSSMETPGDDTCADTERSTADVEVADALNSLSRTPSVSSDLNALAKIPSW